MAKLTAGYLRTIGPKRGRATMCISDPVVGGLQARFGARGRIEFSVVYRDKDDPKQQRRKLGWWWDADRGPAPSYRWITLDQARSEALLTKEEAAQGMAWYARGPGRAPKGKAPQRLPDSVDAILDRYEREHLKTLRTAPTIDKLLRQSLPLDKSISQVTRAEIRAVLDHHMKAGHGYMANRVHALLASFFGWAADRELVPASPMLGMRRPMRKEESRDRVLDDAELAIVWHAVSKFTPDRCAATRMLMLTGCRAAEVTEMRWEEVDKGIWHLPGARAKNGQGRDIHLTPAMLELMGEPGKGRVFPGSAGLGKSYIPDLVKTLPMPNWRLHDLRRSVASGLQALGVQPVVVDKCLGHQAVVKGVAAVYLRAEYLPERKAAMLAWSDHVAAIVAKV